MSKKAEKTNGSGLTNLELFQIEAALVRLVNLDEKMSVESSFKIIKLHRLIAGETKALRDAMKRYMEYEQKAFTASQQNNQTLVTELNEQYAPDIAEAREYLSRPYAGETIPKLKLEIFKKSDGTGVDLPTGLLNVLTPILE